MTATVALISAIGVVLAALLALVGVLTKTAADRSRDRFDDMDALVTQLRKEVERLKGDVSELRNERSADKASIAALEAERAALETERAGDKQHIATLEDHIIRQLPPPPPPRPNRAT